MTDRDRVYPTSKPNGTATNGTNGITATTKIATNNPPLPSFPPTKSQLYNPNRQPYRPQPTRRNRRGRRSCFCCCCFWSILIIIALLLLAAIVGAALYVLYRPHRPTFALNTLKISQFNITTAPDDSKRLTSKLNLTLSSTNPNKKITYIYDPIAIAIYSSKDVPIANGSFQSFTSGPNNITIIHTKLASSSQVLDAGSANSLETDRKKKNGLPVKILLDTKVRVKLDKMKSKKLGIRIKCDGIHVKIPNGKSPTVASTNTAKCKVDLRIKIWKWTF